MRLLRKRMMPPVMAGFLAVSATFGVYGQASVFDPIQALIDNKQYELAIKKLNDLDVLQSQEVDKYRMLAGVYLQTGAGIAAEAAIDRARRLGADYALTSVPYAKALLIQGKYSAAKAALRGVTIPGEFLRDAYIISGDASFAEGQFDQAQRDYELARERDNSNFQAFLGLARLALRQGKLEDARVLATEAEARAADNTMVQYTLGLIARYQGEPEKAEAYFTEAVHLYKDNIMASLELAGIRINQGRIEDAEKLLDTVYTLSSQQPMALYLSGVIKATRGEYEEASAYLGRAKGITDVYLPAIYVKGMVSYQLQKHEAAIESLSKVLGVRPDNRAVRLALATSYSKSERPVTALKVLEPLLAEGAKDVNALTVAGAAAIAAGDAERGQRYYAAASALKSEGAEGGVDGLTTKLALAQFAVGDTGKALATLSSVTAGSEVELRELGLMGSMQLRVKDYDAAKDTIGRILTLAPTRALGYNMRGTLEFKLRQFDASILSYTEALNRSPNYHTARLNRGLSYMNLGNYKEASKDLRLVLESEPGDVLAKAALAKTLLQMGEAKEAAGFFREAVRSMPQSLKLASDYAQALAESGDTTQAIEQARKTAVMGEDDPEVLKRMGLLLLDLEQPAAAERPLSRYAAFNPDMGEAHLLHGRAMLQMGLYTGAGMSFFRAERAKDAISDQEMLDWYFFAAEALGHKYASASKRLPKLVADKRPADVKAGIVGRFLLSTGEHAKAEEAYRIALKAAPASDVIIGLAQALATQGQATKAISELEGYLKKTPGDRLVLSELGQRYEDAGEFERAAKQYEQILRIGVADAHIAARLAYVYLRVGNNQSIKLASSAHLMLPDDPYIQDIYGWVMLQAGRNTEEAVTALEKAVRRAPGNAFFKYHLGMAYLAKGQRYDARRVLQQAVTLDPNFEGADEAKRQLSLLDF